MSWNGSDKERLPRGGVESYVSAHAAHLAKLTRVLVILVPVALAVGMGIWWWFSSQDSKDGANQRSGKHGAIAEVKPSSTTKTVQPSQGQPDPHAGMVLSSTGVWQPADRPFRPGRTKVHAVYTNKTHKSRNPPVYRNATEQLLLQTFGRKLGQPPFPLLKLPKKDMDNLVGILISKSTADEGDSEAVAGAKEVLDLAKAEMMKYIRSGGEPGDFFSYYHGQLMQAFERRNLAKKEIIRIAREEKDPELAKMLQKKVNDELIKDGIQPLKLTLDDDDE